MVSDPFYFTSTENGTKTLLFFVFISMMQSEMLAFLRGAGNCNVGFPSVCEYAPCAVGNKNC